MDISMPVIAGALSTILFGSSMLPMLRKAFITKDLHSYSPAMLLLTNTGNLIHSLYVYSLPPGPIWALHTFHLLSTALMLAWYLRYEWLPHRPRRHPRREVSHRPRHTAAMPSGRGRPFGSST